MTLVGDRELVSNSELRTWKRCRRKWWLTYHRQLVANAPESPVGPRAIGVRGHRALQAYYHPTEARPLLDALEEEIERDRAQLALWDWPEETLARFRSEADLERIVLQGYLDWLAQTGADAGLEPIAVETYLEQPMLLPGVWLVGQLDVRVRREADGAVLFMDHKFQESFGPAHLLPMDEQMLTYDLLQSAEVLTTGTADGALYNVLRTVRRTGRARPPFYQRTEVRHGPHQLWNMRRRVEAEITDIVRTAAGLRGIEDSERQAAQLVYPNPTRDCAWDCPFLHVCPLFDDGSRAEDAVAALFTTGNPLAHYRDRGPHDAGT